MCRLSVFLTQCELSLEWITVTDYTKPHLTGKLLRKLAVKHVREGGREMICSTAVQVYYSGEVEAELSEKALHQIPPGPAQPTIPFWR